MKKTDTILDNIVASKRQRIADTKKLKTFDKLRDEVNALSHIKDLSFFDALKSSKKFKIIAEIKQSSPSSGILRKPFDLGSINESYQSAASVAAISVITEEDFFDGSIANLIYIAQNNTNNKPILRKDFIFDPYQIYETKLIGAHAYLLIASLLDPDELKELVDLGQQLQLEPVIEVTNVNELNSALATNARCIGVNCRDLKTFKTDRKTHGLLKKIDDSYVRIAESAIDDKEYLDSISEFVDASLIGTYFMKSDNIKKAISSLSGEVDA